MVGEVNDGECNEEGLSRWCDSGSGVGSDRRIALGKLVFLAGCGTGHRRGGRLGSGPAQPDARRSRKSRIGTHGRENRDFIVEVVCKSKRQKIEETNKR